MIRSRAFLIIVLGSLFFTTQVAAAGLQTHSMSASTRTVTVSGAVNAYDPLQTGRLFRDSAKVSSCGRPHACPTLNDMLLHRYDIQSFVNNTGVTSCFIVSASIGPNTCSSMVYPVAYSAPPDPANICTNFLADPGSSPVSGAPVTFSFEVAAGAQFWIVVNEVTADSHCGGYTLTVSAELDKGDFNLDRKGDIVLRNPVTGQNALWLMNNTTLSSVVDLPALSGTSWHFSATADFNGDGHPDLLLHNNLTNQNAVWLMNGASLISTVDLPIIADSCWLPRGAGDFDNDGSPDILFHNACTGSVALWLMNETTYLSTANVTSLPTAYEIGGVGDMNGDGSPDIVIRNNSTGQIAAWLMKGTAYSSTVDLPALANPCYKIQAIDDYNGDGKDDVVFRNTCNGLNAVWLMNYTALGSVVDLPALTNVNYEFGGPR